MEPQIRLLFTLIEAFNSEELKKTILLSPILFKSNVYALCVLHGWNSSISLQEVWKAIFHLMSWLLCSLLVISRPSKTCNGMHVLKSFSFQSHFTSERTHQPRTIPKFSGHTCLHDMHVTSCEQVRCFRLWYPSTVILTCFFLYIFFVCMNYIVLTVCSLLFSLLFQFQFQYERCTHHISDPFASSTFHLFSS